MSMLFTAWLTAAAFEDARRCFNSGPVSISLDAWGHGEICEKYLALVVAVNEHSRRGSLTMDILPLFIHGLATPWEAILDYQGRTYTGKELCESESVVQKPAAYITVDENTDDRVNAERSLMDLLLCSIKKTFVSEWRQALRLGL